PDATRSARLWLREVKDGALHHGGGRFLCRESAVRNVGAKEQWERARNRNCTEPICRSGRIRCEVRNDKECSREDGQANCVEDRNATREAAKCRFPDGG